MMSEKPQEAQVPTITTLRKGFISCCKALGLRQNTTEALAMLMSSRELLTAILHFMVEIEKNGQLENMDIEDRTTMMVKVASELREAWDKARK